MYTLSVRVVGTPRSKLPAISDVGFTWIIDHVVNSRGVIQKLPHGDPGGHSKLPHPWPGPHLHGGVDVPTVKLAIAGHETINHQSLDGR